MKWKKWLISIMLAVGIIATGIFISTNGNIIADVKQPQQQINQQHVTLEDTTNEILDTKNISHHYELLAIPFSAMALICSILYLKRIQKKSDKQNNSLK